MPEIKNCEYLLVRYAPSMLRETSVVIGLFLFEASDRLVRYRITSDWRQLRCLDPEADLTLLEALSAYFERLAGEVPVPGEVSGKGRLYPQLLRMQEEYSGSIQISLPRGVETADPEEEFERLFAEYVERPRPAKPALRLREGSRPWVHARLREELERHNLMEAMMRDVPVERFTAPGDAFRIDFAYRPNGVTKYLHALSLERDWNQAKLLSYTFWRIRQHTEARMTAIVSDADPALPAVQGCRRILSEAQIVIQPLSQLNPFLEEIRGELGRL